MMRKQGVKTETSIKDLNTLACKLMGHNQKNLNDSAARTLSTEGSLSNSSNFLDFSPIDGSSSSAGGNGSYARKMNLSGESFESLGSSFSDLAKERSLDGSSRKSFESSDFNASFTASNSSLDWAPDEPFPKSKRCSATASTHSSNPDIASEFVVLSAFQLDSSDITNADEDGEEYLSEDDSGSEQSEEEEEDEEGDEEFPVVDFDEEDTQIAMIDGEHFFKPSPRDSIIKRGDTRRTSLQKEKEKVLQPLPDNKSPEDQAADVALCQHLARSGLEPRRGRGRQRSTKLHQPSSLLRGSSQTRSTMTDCDVESLKQGRLRSLSRTHRTPSITRGQSHHSRARDRSVSRDRSTATAPAATQEIRIERPLLGKALGDESDEEDDDPWACPWINKGRSRASAGAPDQAESSKDAPMSDDSLSRSLSSQASTRSKRERRIRATMSLKEQGTDSSVRNKTRRSLRATKSAEQERGTPRRTSSKRTYLKDCSARSNPEQRNASLGERLSHLKDFSARSNPERSQLNIQDEDETSVDITERLRRCDSKPSKPRRTRSKAKQTTGVPPLSIMLEGNNKN